MFDLSSIITKATTALLKASLGSSSDSTNLNSSKNDPNRSSDDKGTRWCDADNCDMPVRDKIHKDDAGRQHDLTTMIVSFTTTPSEDIRAICERASATEASAKEATETLSSVFTSGDPSQQLSATRLWAHFLLYSPELFLCQCAKPEFLDVLEDVLNSRSTFQVVREHLLHVLAGAVYASSRTSYQGVSGLGVLWRKVKPAEEPDEGAPFYQDDAMTNFLSRRNTENKSKNMRIRRNSGEGDHSLLAQRTACTEPASSVQRLVECRMCMDRIPVGSIVHVDSCGHTFCRKCLHGYMIAACADGLTFPIHCPACTADKGKGKETASAISQSPDLNFERADSYPPSIRPHSHDDLLHATAASSEADSIQTAMRLQREFDDEDFALLLQRAELVNFDEPLSECSICTDEVPVDSIARIDSCGHAFCRDCLRGHVKAPLEELEFPVLCPICTAEGKETASAISQSPDLNFGRADSYPPYSQDDSLYVAAASSEMDSIQTAMRLQREFDDEDFALSLQRDELVDVAEPLFECSICMDDVPMDSITRIDSCGHTFCRECLRGQIAHLEGPVFPVRCPTCTADKRKGKETASDLNFGRAGSYPPSMRPHSQDDSLHATAASSEVDSIQTAMRLQREFDDEDRALSQQRAELVNVAEPLFECSICMDDMPMGSIARIDSCGHTFCRECLRGHVAARLEERVFPVRCPTCTADKGKGTEPTGEISQSLALELGLTVEQFNIWTEMEMAAFSILVHCRRCERSMFVARDEHDAVNVLACPLSDCDHIWCKHCQQSIDPNGPEHSCDGTSELDHLMKEQGWKYCPTCKTPIQKTSGCDHMSCRCNTRFCYRCGRQGCMC